MTSNALAAGVSIFGAYYFQQDAARVIENEKATVARFLLRNWATNGRFV
jgi:hypothetical protein